MNIAHLLIHTITYAPLSGRSATGDPTFGAQATCVARVERKLKLVRSADGSERQAVHQITTQTSIGLFDRIWLPGEDTTDNNVAHRPLAVDSAPTLNGSMTLYQVWL